MFTVRYEGELTRSAWSHGCALTSDRRRLQQQWLPRAVSFFNIRAESTHIGDAAPPLSANAQSSDPPKHARHLPRYGNPKLRAHVAPDRDELVNMDFGSVNPPQGT